MEFGADTAAELPRGFLGEGNYDHFSDLGGAAAHDLQYAVNKDGGLAGPGTCLQEVARLQVSQRVIADSLVQWLRQLCPRSREIRLNGSRRAALPGALRIASSSTRVLQTS